MQKSKGKRNYVIPAEFNTGSEMVPWDRYPDALIFGDSVLADVLDTTRSTIQIWKKKGIIPFRQAPGYSEYKLIDVIEALRNHGYGQDWTGNPTGPASSQYPQG